MRTTHPPSSRSLSLGISLCAFFVSQHCLYEFVSCPSHVCSWMKPHPAAVLCCWLIALCHISLLQTYLHWALYFEGENPQIKTLNETPDSSAILKHALFPVRQQWAMQALWPAFTLLIVPLDLVEDALLCFLPANGHHCRAMSASKALPIHHRCSLILSDVSSVPCSWFNCDLKLDAAAIVAPVVVLAWRAPCARSCFGSHTWQISAFQQRPLGVTKRHFPLFLWKRLTCTLCYMLCLLAT